MQEQLTRMQVGDGVALYPRPLVSSPHVPVVETHTLNACPVYSLWFECFDYSSLGCAHTYHPYCSAEYARKASNCLVPCNQEPFSLNSLAPIGIWPSTCSAVEAKVLHSVTEEVIGKHDTAGTATGATSLPILSWRKESPEKITPLSLSSQTDAISKQCSPERKEKTSSQAMVCELCQVEDAPVFVKACGHDIFCFRCIERLKDCPICSGAITSWGRNNPRSKPGPSFILVRVDSKLHGDHGAVFANIVQVEEKLVCPTLEAEKADSFADDSSDGSDSNNGLV